MTTNNDALGGEPMSDFRVIGDGPNPFAAKRRTLTSDEILRVLSWDPNRDMDHGRLRAVHHRLESGRGLGGRVREQELIEWALNVEPKRPLVDQIYDNPARLADWRREKQALSPGDLEFVRTFDGADPRTVSFDDVRHLAELEVTSESESERRVVGRVLAPIRRHHDRKEEEARLRGEIARHTPSAYRCAAVRDAWLPVLSERLAEEARQNLEPHLVGLPADLRETTISTAEQDAHLSAQTQVKDLWARLNSEVGEKISVAQQRLSALASGGDPESSAPIRSNTNGLEEGRRRGREAREAREATGDAFAGFRMLGR